MTETKNIETSSTYSCDATSSLESSFNEESNYIFSKGQRNRTLIHPVLPQPSKEEEKSHLNNLINNEKTVNNNNYFNMPKSEMTRYAESYSFVVCADTQLGMTNMNQDWNIELDNTRKAVQLINSLENKPSFCVCCGDLA